MVRLLVGRALLNAHDADFWLQLYYASQQTHPQRTSIDSGTLLSEVFRRMSTRFNCSPRHLSSIETVGSDNHRYSLFTQCPECHAESQDHMLRKTIEMAFICKKCRKAFRKDLTQYEESDEFCPHCDNHYVRLIQLVSLSWLCLAYRRSVTFSAPFLILVCWARR